MSERQNKCWRYSRNPDDKNDNKWYIFAFVNGKGACSLRRFDASDGKHLETLYKKGEGDFQENFIEYLNPTSLPLRLRQPPNLEEDCKEELPKEILLEIKKQVIELATSALLGVLDR